MIHLFKTTLFAFFFLHFASYCTAQKNLRVWYADGQVWMVWEIKGFPPAQTVGIYAKSTPFTQTSEATLIGRPFNLEYLPLALKEQVDSSLTYRIPNGQGGLYQLAPNEGLFVSTPHQAGSLYFAVADWDSTTVTAGVNRTANAVPFNYDPISDPVECHLQSTFPSPFAPGYICAAFYMWADGRPNQWENRPDFPVMANAAKNGMPSFFMVSIPTDLDTTQTFPMSVWLHGGGGSARQSLAGSRKEINIEPEKGILLAHNDNLFGYRDSMPPNSEQPSWHFGWRKNYNPFQIGNSSVAPTDTIVNYTQRRYLWIDQWLIRHYNIDPARIHIHGHSMGSAGATAMAKCYPDHYASVTIFNNGCNGPENPQPVLGLDSDNLPTNLKNRRGETVHFNSVVNLIDNCSKSRDLPLIRFWHSKNDDNSTMMWDANVVHNFRVLDSIGTGVQMMWSERAHGVDTGPDYNDHWVRGIPATEQTILDNVAYAEAHFSSVQSYPAFFNHHLDPQNNDPGTGMQGINNGDGDNWGSWGGWHRWDESTLVENTAEWRFTAWLATGAVFDNDNCPFDHLTADVALRRPQSFRPPSGATLYWDTHDVATGALLQEGMVTVQDDDLVVIPGLTLYKSNVRKVRVHIFNPAMALQPEPVRTAVENLKIFPNPSRQAPLLAFSSEGDAPAGLQVYSMEGRLLQTSVLPAAAGDNRLYAAGMELLPPGVYQIQVRTETVLFSGKWVKI